MLTLFQSTILRSIGAVFIFTIGIWNFAYPRLSIRQILVVFFIFWSGFSFVYLNLEYIALISFLLVGIYLYKLPDSTPWTLASIPISYVAGAILDNVISILFFIFFHIDYDEFIFSRIYFPLFICILMPIHYITTFIGGLLIQKLCLKQHTTFSKSLFVMIMSNLLLCSAITLVNVLFGEKVGYTKKNVTFNCTLFLFYFCVSLFTMYRSLKSNEASMRAKQKLEQYESLREYTANLEHVYHNLRSFKHDYINIMASISSFLEEGEYDALHTYFNTYILPLKSTMNQNTETLNNLMNVHVLELKSLLSVKLMSAMEQGIQVTIDIPDTIDQIRLNPIDLTRVLGIYLDNAMEAASETERPVIAFHMASVHNCIAIMIANSFLDKGLPVSEMAQLNVTSKGENHGIGLYNANQILNQYDTVFHETYIEDRQFIQHLQIQNS